LHHADDLLTQDAAARHDRFCPAQEVILRSPPDGTPTTTGGSRLSLHVLPALGHLRLSDIRSSDVQQLADDLLHTHNPSTVHKSSCLSA